jgi:two-component system CheB/CheR fusion protein
MPLFHYSLNPGGLLLLGSSESIGGFMDLFSPRDNKWKLFERREDHVARRSLVEFPTSAHPHLAQMHEAETEQSGSNASIIEMAQTNILQTIAPPVVLINDQGDILYITRQTGKYLEPPVGKANLNIYAMAREGVREVLGVAIREAKTEKRKVTIEGLKVMGNGSSQNINLVITPFDKPEAMRGLMMVLFEDVAKPSIEAGDTNCKSRSTSRLKVINEELEKELQYTKENLQTIIEEMETSQEELKSANEELQSTNEELQSTNEEMVTSKEELQSLNEELITLNAELQSKNEALSETSDDLKNLLDSTQIATLFLDNNLKIKRFTPYVTKIISLIQSDMGRPITDIVSNLQYDDLVKDVNEVLETLVSKETQVQTRDGGSYRLHIVPYRTVDNAIDGVVITFTDVTDFRKMAEGMTERTLYAEAIIRTVREPLVVLDSEMKIVSANPSFYRMFHVAPEETEGQTLYSLGNGQWNIPAMRQLLEKILPQDTQIEGFLMEHEFPIIGKRRMLLNARRIAQEGSSKELILLAIEDITDQKEQSQISIGGG